MATKFKGGRDGFCQDFLKAEPTFHFQQPWGDDNLARKEASPATFKEKIVGHISISKWVIFHFSNTWHPPWWAWPAISWVFRCRNQQDFVGRGYSAVFVKQFDFCFHVVKNSEIHFLPFSNWQLQATNVYTRTLTMSTQNFPTIISRNLWQPRTAYKSPPCFCLANRIQTFLLVAK